MSRMSRSARRAQQHRYRRSTGRPHTAPLSRSQWWWVRSLLVSLALMAAGTALMYTAVADVATRPDAAAPKAAPVKPATVATGAPAVGQATARAAQGPSREPVAQEIARLQYTVDQRKSWHNVMGITKADAAVIPEGAIVGLRAVKAFPELDWPGLKPLWHKDTYKYYGPEIWVMFNRETEGDNLHIVTAECKNTLSAAIRVVPAYFLQLGLGPKARSLGVGEPIPLTATVKRWRGGTEAGLRVRFQALLKNGTATGEINGPGTQDDTVTCDAAGHAEATFTPSAAGKVRVVASLLKPGGDQVEDAQGMQLEVHNR